MQAFPGRAFPGRAFPGQALPSQVLPSQASRCDRGGRVDKSRREPCGLFAFAFMCQRNPGRPAYTIIEEGLAVATAHHQFRSGDLRAEPRFSRADTRQIVAAARSRLPLAEQAFIARLPDKSAAGLAGSDRTGGGGNENDQRQRCEK